MSKKLDIICIAIIVLLKFWQVYNVYTVNVIFDKL